MSPLAFHGRNRQQQVQPRRRLLVEQLEDRSLLAAGFNFTALAVTGGPAPGGGNYTFDFESGGINNQGQVVYTADLDAGSGDFGEGIFIAGKGGAVQVLRAGQAAPGGGTFGGFGSLSPDAINDSGDVAVSFGLDPLTLPIGTNAGTYRYDHATGKLSAIVVPGVTAAPGGGTFQGSLFHPSINNNGDVAFAGIVPATIGPGSSIDLGAGVFVADKQGHLTDVARPGDATAPGGKTFDFAQNPSIDNRGDVAFGAHILGEPIKSLGQTLPLDLFAGESEYVKDGATGAIRSVAHQDAAIPASAGGGTYDYAYGAVLNNRGQILFAAGLKGSPGVLFNGSLVDNQALFVDTNGTVTAVARLGMAMPGGGNLVSTSFNPGNFDINSSGDVAFSALLDTGEEGVYLWSKGTLTLIAKTGDVIPGVGTVAGFDQYGTGLPNAYVHLNDGGQVAFGAVLTDGNVALLVASARGNGNGKGASGLAVVVQALVSSTTNTSGSSGNSGTTSNTSSSTQTGQGQTVTTGTASQLTAAGAANRAAMQAAHDKLFATLGSDLDLGIG
jgi:hypothetical protein